MQDELQARQLKGVGSLGVMKIMLSHGRHYPTPPMHAYTMWHRSPTTLTCLHSSLAGQAVYPEGMTSRNPTHPAGTRGTRLPLARMEHQVCMHQLQEEAFAGLANKPGCPR